MLIDFRLSGIGWIEFFLDINNNEYYSDASYISEPLIDLVDGIITLIPGYIPDDEIKKKFTIKLELEPAIENWIFELVNKEELRIIIKKIVDDTIEVTFDETCNFRSFISDLLISLDKILVTYGIIGYKDTWCRGDFPIAGYLKLKCYQLNKLVEYSEYPDGMGIPLLKSDLENEINILKRLLS